MLQRLNRMREKEQGFTLIELLIVIIILGILAAIVVFAVGNITDKGQTSACDTDRKTVETAEEAYFAQHGNYADESALVPQYMHQQSNLYDVTNSSTAYTIQVADAKCGTVGATVS